LFEEHLQARLSGEISLHFLRTGSPKDVPLRNFHEDGIIYALCALKPEPIKPCLSLDRAVGSFDSRTGFIFVAPLQGLLLFSTLLQPLLFRGWMGFASPDYWYSF